MARVLVAFCSFFADDFSRFFFEALWTLYIVNLPRANFHTRTKGEQGPPSADRSSRKCQLIVGSSSRRRERPERIEMREKEKVLRIKYWTLQNGEVLCRTTRSEIHAMRMKENSGELEIYAKRC